MKRTIRWPPVLAGGRATMTAAPDDPTADHRARTEALRQVIRTCVLDCASTHPWNAGDNLGTRDPTFVAARRDALGRLEADITRQFERLQRDRRARLVQLDVKPGGNDTPLTVLIVFEDLEHGDRQQLEVPVG